MTFRDRHIKCSFDGERVTRHDIDCAHRGEDRSPEGQRELECLACGTKGFGLLDHDINCLGSKDDVVYVPRPAEARPGPCEHGFYPNEDAHACFAPRRPEAPREECSECDSEYRFMMHKERPPGWHLYDCATRRERDQKTSETTEAADGKPNQGEPGSAMRPPTRSRDHLSPGGVSAEPGTTSRSGPNASATRDTTQESPPEEQTARPAGEGLTSSPSAKAVSPVVPPGVVALGGDSCAAPTPSQAEAKSGTCNRCWCACDCCVDRVRGKLVPASAPSSSDERPKETP